MIGVLLVFSIFFFFSWFLAVLVTGMIGVLLVFSIFLFFSWFLAVLVTGMIGVLLVFIIVMVEFIAYFTDKDKGDILLPYIGMLMYQR